MKAKPETAWCWKWDEPNPDVFLLTYHISTTRRGVIEKIKEYYPQKDFESHKTWRQRTRRAGIKVVKVEVKER